MVGKPDQREPLFKGGLAARALGVSSRLSETRQGDSHQFHFSPEMCVHGRGISGVGAFGSIFFSRNLSAEGEVECTTLTEG
jgi:hypothetical protein